jgi:aquaporin-3
VVLIGALFGFDAGYAINPARDFGPRLFTAVAGWGPGVFTAANHWWWVPIVAPPAGAVIGGFAYDCFIGNRFPFDDCILRARAGNRLTVWTDD